MSNSVIVVIIVLVFVVVLFVLWRGGRFSARYRDIGVDVEAARQPELEEPTPAAAPLSDVEMSMTATGKGSAIRGSKQVASGLGGGVSNTSMRLAVKDGGQIEDAEQRAKGQDS